MKLIIVLYTLLILAVVLVIYRFLINPTILINPTAGMLSGCPDRWSYDPSTRLCSPNYETKCHPFDPSKYPTFAQRCHIAKRCGTDWAGLCL